MPAIQLDEAKRKMSAIRGSLGREVDQIRNNPRCSDSGRAQKLAKSRLAQRNQADSLRSNFCVNNEDVPLKLTAKLFGIPNRADPLENHHGSNLRRNALDAVQLRLRHLLGGRL